MRRFLASLAIAMLVLSCGQPNASNHDPIKPDAPKEPQVGGIKISMMLFGAPWCTNCRAISEIDKLLKDELTRDNPQLKGTLLVTTGERPSMHPTQQIATAYRDHLQVSFDADIDEWYYKKYRQHVNDDGDPILPAVVVFDDKGAKIKVFGATSALIPAEIAAFVKEKLK